MILIDALDESGLAGDKENNDLLLILQYHLTKLPTWIAILITGRPESQLQERLNSQFFIYELEANSIENQQDINNYVRANVHCFVEKSKLDAVVDTIWTKCEGIFLSARLMLHEHGIDS